MANESKANDGDGANKIGWMHDRKTKGRIALEFGWHCRATYNHGQNNEHHGQKRHGAGFAELFNVSVQ